MTFVFRMALREIRSSWQRLLFFFICIAIGVAAIIALRSVIQSVRVGMSQEAQALVAADILLTSNNEFTPKVIDTLKAEQQAGHVTATSQAIEIPTMVRPAGMLMLVSCTHQLKDSGAMFVTLFGSAMLFKLLQL